MAVVRLPASRLRIGVPRWVACFGLAANFGRWLAARVSTLDRVPLMRWQVAGDGWLLPGKRAGRRPPQGRQGAAQVRPASSPSSSYFLPSCRLPSLSPPCMVVGLGSLSSPQARTLLCVWLLHHPCCCRFSRRNLTRVPSRCCVRRVRRAERAAARAAGGAEVRFNPFLARCWSRLRRVYVRCCCASVAPAPSLGCSRSICLLFCCSECHRGGDARGL